MFPMFSTEVYVNLVQILKKEIFYDTCATPAVLFLHLPRCYNSSYELKKMSCHRQQAEVSWPNYLTVATATCSTSAVVVHASVVTLIWKYSDLTKLAPISCSGSNTKFTILGTVNSELGIWLGVC